MTVETKHSEWRRELPVIDMHCHFDPESVDECIRYMDRVGVRKIVDITPNFGEQLTGKLDVVRSNPDRFGVFAGVDFDGFGESGWVDRERERVEQAIDAGAIGIKFWKDLGLEHVDQDGTIVRVDDDRLEPIIDAVGARDGVVAFHISDLKAFFEPLTPDNERWELLQDHPDWWFGDRSEYPYDWWQLIRQLETVIARHPDTTILGVHFGCAAEEVGYVADVMRNHPNYVVDIAARVSEIGRHAPETVRDVFVEFQDRILFGTDLIVRETRDRNAEEVERFYDAHWRYFETDERDLEPPFTDVDWTIDGIDLPREVLRKFYRDNALHHLDC